MRLRNIGLLVLSLLIVSWGIPATARADDVQQSKYSVTLTKPATISHGGGGAIVNPGGGTASSSSSSTTSPTGAGTNGGQGATVSPTKGKATQVSSQLTGRLPQTSEEWFGFGTMAGIIMLLLVWIGILLKKRKQEN